MMSHPLDPSSPRPPSGKDDSDPDLHALWILHRERLRRMIVLRMDRRLRSRLDPSDVLQEAYLDVANRYHEHQQKTPEFPLFLWLRTLTLQRLTKLHRLHLQTDKRDVGREISLKIPNETQASSDSLAERLLGQFTSPSQAFERAERKQALQTVLESMHELDREILALRYFEDLNNTEAALVLGIDRSAASNRHVRALRRLDKALEAIPHFYHKPS